MQPDIPYSWLLVETLPKLTPLEMFIFQMYIYWPMVLYTGSMFLPLLCYCTSTIYLYLVILEYWTEVIFLKWPTKLYLQFEPNGTKVGEINDTHFLLKTDAPIVELEGQAG